MTHYDYRLLDSDVWRQVGAYACRKCGSWVADIAAHDAKCWKRKHKRKTKRRR